MRAPRLPADRACSLLLFADAISRSPRSLKLLSSLSTVSGWLEAGLAGQGVLATASWGPRCIHSAARSFTAIETRVHCGRQPQSPSGRRLPNGGPVSAAVPAPPALLYCCTQSPSSIPNNACALWGTAAPRNLRSRATEHSSAELPTALLADTNGRQQRVIPRLLRPAGRSIPPRSYQSPGELRPQIRWASTAGRSLPESADTGATLSSSPEARIPQCTLQMALAALQYCPSSTCSTTTVGSES